MNVNFTAENIGFNIDEVVQKCSDKIKAIDLKHLNIVVTGRSGAGKKYTNQ